MKHSSPLKRTPLKPTKRTRIKPISDKRRLANATRAAMMLERFGPREFWRCQLGPIIQTPCYGPVNGHEVKSRAQGGSITDPDNIMLACNLHNDWAEDHPLRAKELGLKT